MKKYFIILIFLIVGISAMLFFSEERYSTPSSINFLITIAPEHESYIIESKGKAEKQEDLMSFYQYFTGVSLEDNTLWSAEISFLYDIENNTLDDFIVVDITGSEYLDYASLVFLEELILPMVGKNLFSWATDLGERSIRKGFFNTSYTRNLLRKDTIGNRQNIILSLVHSCKLWYYFWREKECSVYGDYSVSTPLNSWPLRGRLEGLFSTSLLQ